VSLGVSQGALVPGAALLVLGELLAETLLGQEAQTGLSLLGEVFLELQLGVPDHYLAGLDRQAQLLEDVGEVCVQGVSVDG
jgi:hypothetical protein